MPRKAEWWHDRDEYLRRWEAAGWNIRAMAQVTGASESTLSKWRGIHGLDFPAHINPRGNHRPVTRRAAPPPLVPILEQELVIEGDALLSSDWHAPITHYDTFHRMLDDAERSGLTTGVCAGDLTNEDELAKHEPKQRGAGMEEAEIPHLHYQVGVALDVFDRLVVTLGNHDRHHHEQTKISFDRSLRQLLCDLPKDKLDRIIVTGRDYVIIETERGPWRVCHTRAYRKLPLSYPNALALRHGMHIAAGHRHHYAHGKAANGKDIAELGGLMEHERMAYTTRYTNDLPEMQRGYARLVGGHLTLPMLSS